MDSLSWLMLISTLAPREGSDHPGSAATGDQGISTLAPREGSDRFEGLRKVVYGNFNPRSPRGERPRRH